MPAIVRKTVCNYHCRARRVCESCGDCWCRHTRLHQRRLPVEGWDIVYASADSPGCEGFWEGGGG